MKITLLESKYTPNHFEIEYSVEESLAFEPSDELLDKNLSHLVFDKKECLEVINLIERDYKNALNSKANKLQQSLEFENDLNTMFPTITFEVTPNI